MQRSKKIAIWAVVVVAILGLVTIGAFNAFAKDTAPTKATKTDAPVKVAATFGNKDGAIGQLQLRNHTGYEVTGIDAAYTGSEKWQALKAGKGAYTDNSVANIYIPKGLEPAAEPVEKVEGARDLAVKDQYDLRITFADGSKYVLYQIGANDYDNTKDLTLDYSVEEQIVYLCGKNAAGQTFTTLESQKVMSAQAAADKAAAEKAAAEAKAAEQAAADAAAQQAAADAAAQQAAAAQQVAPAPAPAVAPAPAPEPAPATVPQTGDSCLGDVALQ